MLLARHHGSFYQFSVRNILQNNQPEFN